MSQRWEVTKIEMTDQENIITGPYLDITENVVIYNMSTILRKVETKNKENAEK